MEAARNSILDVYFNSATQITSWFVELIRDDNFTGIVATDTALTHPGWEIGTEYIEGTRPAWAFDTPIVNEEIENTTTAAQFSINASQTFKGAAIYSNNTKGGTSGLLLAAGLFDSGDKILTSGDILQVTYGITTTG